MVHTCNPSDNEMEGGGNRSLEALESVLQASNERWKAGPAEFLSG